MNKEINLIKQPEETHIVDDGRIQKGTKLSIVILVVFALFVLSIFIYGVYLQADKGKLDSLVAEKEQSINSMKEKEYLYRVYKSKLAVANTILSGRSDLVPILDFLENTTSVIEKTTPNGIEFHTLSVPNLNTITIQAAAKDSTILDDFLSLLVKNDLNKYFKTIHLDALSRVEDRGYEFSLTLALSNVLK